MPIGALAVCGMGGGLLDIVNARGSLHDYLLIFVISVITNLYFIITWTGTSSENRVTDF